jgi:putative nucleotidyltransferase with HDIG domain
VPGSDTTRPPRDAATQAAHGPARARNLAAQAEQLPLLPTVVIRVLQLDPGSDRYFEGLLAIAEEDPTFAVRLIRLANSPANAPVKPIVTIRQAVVRLGARECAGLVTALAVSRVFVPTTVAQRNLWLHALQTAVAARVIANLLVERRVPPEQAYLAGLLHDIGRFVMFETAADDLGRVDDTHWHSPQQMLDAEHSLLGYDHVQLGALVCRRWSIPPLIAGVVSLHHDYGAPRAHQATTLGALVATVQLADLLSARLIDAPELADLDPLQMTAELSTHCVRTEWPNPPVSSSVLAQCVAAIRDEAAEIAERLLDLGPSRSR